jgi:nitroreductase
MEAIAARHSVRSYTGELISEGDRKALREEIDRCNEEGGLHISLVCDDPEAFDSAMAHYGKFSGVRDYLVLAGPASPTLEERCGYYGERLVLLAQQLGLNTCWVALTFKKRYVKRMLAAGDKLVVVIALGHGATQGASRKSKAAEQVCRIPTGVEVPDWFVAGLDAALLAPTAMNQQSFEFELTGRAVVADGEKLEDCAENAGKPIVALRSKGGGYAKVDLGIVRLHFELGAQSIDGDFTWANPLQS